jgi:nucleolar protein 14
MQRRHKVGGILDRRFGENDPTMTPEEKMLERFAREKLKSHKKHTLFDLEDDDGDSGEGLTHGGKSITFDDEEPVDDFAEDDLDSGDDSDGSVRERQRLKRVRAMGTENGEDGEDDQPDRKKSKKEVMEEVIAKSKMHKFERQAAKEEDEDLRAELDKELPDIQRLLSQGLRNRTDQERPEPSSIAGRDRSAFDREFDVQVKKLAQDRRAQPADRTKTEEEKAEDESKRLKELEDKRQRRMRGESVSDSNEEDEPEPQNDEQESDSDDEFGLGKGINARPTAAELGFDDEDDFVIDRDLVASGSDLESIDSDDASDELSDDDGAEADGGEDEDDFTKGILNEEEARNPVFDTDSVAKTAALKKGDENGLPYTFPCPASLEDFQDIASQYSKENLPTIVQRIRALHHPRLDSKNKEKLAQFSRVLVDFISAPWDPASSPPFSVLESLIRHIHSLAKMFPIDIGEQFRDHLSEIGSQRPLALQPGDLILLTAIGTIFPTSDHFHQVVTPAMLAAARFLGTKVPHDLADHAVGTYLSILVLQYQQLSKRYVPEIINFVANTICALSPVAPPKALGKFPLHESPSSVRVESATKAKVRKLTFSDCIHDEQQGKDKECLSLQVSILSTSLQVCDAAADVWAGKSAFTETMSQIVSLTQHLNSKKCRAHMPAALCEKSEKLQSKLERMIRVAEIARRPLELHHHRPLAIKTYIPKFEETFDPDKHYDPDRERAELAKLKAEHKKERKGAMRELRKDANFMARENLRVKKAKDEAYEKKYKRLVAEIQSEEGREANAYAREKSARKRARNR